MNLTANLQRATQMHMMKAIDVDMMMDGLEENILVLVLRLQQVPALQQEVVMMVATSIKIALPQLLAQQLLEVEEVA